MEEGQGQGSVLGRTGGSRVARTAVGCGKGSGRVVDTLEMRV